MTDSLLNFGNFPEIGGDGVEPHFIGRNVHFHCWGWRKIDGIWRRVIVGLAILPQECLPAENLARLRRVFAADERQAHAMMN